MIELANVVKNYGAHRALKNISFNIKKGEIVGLLGPNGAGKTTTMRIITGFIPATSGNVYVNGHEVHEDPMEVKRLIGYMPENIALYPEMRIKDYLEFCAALKQLPFDVRQKRVEYAMELVKLTDRKDFIIGRLSKGYRQRVGLAQAILHDPQVLILDEPMVGLDPTQIVEIRSLIKSLSGNRTVILSTHILSEVERTCSRVIIIKQGNIIADDSVDGIKAKVGHKINGNSVKVTLRNRVDDAVVALRRMLGVVSVRKDVENNILIESEVGRDLRLDVTKYLTDKGFDIVESKLNHVDLEEVFLHITANKQ